MNIKIAYTRINIILNKKIRLIIYKLVTKELLQILISNLVKIKMNKNIIKILIHNYKSKIKI